MSLSFNKLNKLMAETVENELTELLSSFKCSAEPSAEHFLQRVAVGHEKAGISRTYIALDTDDTGFISVKGFFTIAIKCLSVNGQHSIPSGMIEQMNVNKDIAQAYLLGQLAKADGVEKGFGKEMIGIAMDFFSKGKEMFGCSVVRLDCKDRMIDYYESLGFFFMKKNMDNTLNQMIAII